MSQVQYALVQRFVLRNDLRLIESRGTGYTRSARTFPTSRLEKLKGRVRHRVRIANGNQRSRLSILHDFRQPADSAGYDRHAARHGFERTESERFGCAWQQL